MSGTRDQGNILGTMPVDRLVLTMSAPIMVSMLVSAVYNLVDSIYVAQVSDLDFLALSYAYPVQLMMVAFCTGIGVGFNATFAQRLGEGKGEEANRVACHGFLFYTLCWLLFLAFALFGAPLFFRLSTGDPVVARAGVQYLTICCGASIGMCMQFLTERLLQTTGHPAGFMIVQGSGAVLNIVLDLVFVVAVPWGVAGAAFATSFSQWVSGVGLLVYTWKRMAHLRPSRQDVYWKKDRVGEIARFSLLTCVQQSVMNFGILMVQGLVNSFGTVVMAAFAAAVKIDSFAYMPVQDFGNAFSTFIAQNYGARDMGRIRRGIRSAVLAAAVFSGAVSVLVCVFAEPLLLLFVKPEEREILAVGVQYLRVEGAFYVGIGILFLLYGLYRAIQRPGMSLVLTVISLGTRVALAYALSAIPAIGVVGIWWSVPIGWALADVAGVVYYKRNRDRLLRPQQPQKGANP